MHSLITYLAKRSTIVLCQVNVRRVGCVLESHHRANFTLMQGLKMSLCSIMTVCYHPLPLPKNVNSIPIVSTAD